jgi:SAM-dependent methyltransferase
VPGRWAYNVLYWTGAARRRLGWDKGAGPELVDLLSSGRLTPEGLPSNRAVDLGCGTGENVLLLAERGFDATGVDFSSVAVAKAQEAAAARGLARRARFLVGDVTAPSIDGLMGPFGLVVAYNTLQDLTGRARTSMAATIHRLTDHGSAVVLWCYYAEPSELPPLSFRGPSRLFPFVVTPGEEQELFGEAFTIERLARPLPESRTACFLMVRD